MFGKVESENMETTYTLIGFIPYRKALKFVGLMPADFKRWSQDSKLIKYKYVTCNGIVMWVYKKSDLEHLMDKYPVHTYKKSEPLKFNEYMKIHEAARFVGVTPNTLRNWDNSGKLKGYRSGFSNYRLYKKTDLIDILNSIRPIE